MDNLKRLNRAARRAKTLRLVRQFNLPFFRSQEKVASFEEDGTLTPFNIVIMRAFQKALDRARSAVTTAIQESNPQVKILRIPRDPGKRLNYLKQYRLMHRAKVLALKARNNGQG